MAVIFDRELGGHWTGVYPPRRAHYFRNLFPMNHMSENGAGHPLPPIPKRESTGGET